MLSYLVYYLSVDAFFHAKVATTAADAAKAATNWSSEEISRATPSQASRRN